MQHLNHLSKSQQESVLALIKAAHDFDGTPAIAEHVLLHLRHGGDKSDSHLVIEENKEVIAYDHIPAHHAVRELYESDELMTFVAGVLGQEKLYRYADPFGALNLAVMREGDQLGWHFDMTDFVVSLALQPSQAGGEFENAQKLRTATDENYGDVQSILSGNACHRIRVEPMHAGSLMIFNGRTSLHKVTPIEGHTLRIVAL